MLKVLIYLTIASLGLVSQNFTAFVYAQNPQGFVDQHVTRESSTKVIGLKENLGVVTIHVVATDSTEIPDLGYVRIKGLMNVSLPKEGFLMLWIKPGCPNPTK